MNRLDGLWGPQWTHGADDDDDGPVPTFELIERLFMALVSDGDADFSGATLHGASFVLRSEPNDIWKHAEAAGLMGYRDPVQRDRRRDPRADAIGTEGVGEARDEVATENGTGRHSQSRSLKESAGATPLTRAS